ncbi:MAG: PAS/PAC sensor hybrid histidine kinase [Candidatus Ozemobacter sibiricus]|uniref:histidine kinase n=1 Tax=Candidatus Ozemobacter sibiricus TaxID=2268124 RepID=A0A367ZCX7_9BACT|nr:MAG: PAS/PAC sensor hybrid histidine kinase [Candidatus Ozemobacter sibiricus]
MFEAVGNPIFVKDRKHRWVLVNEAFCRFVGRPRDTLLGASDYDFFPKEQADFFWSRDEKVFASRGTDLTEESLTDAQGETHIILTRKSFFEDEQGTEFLVGIITDLTSWKEQAAASRRASEERFRAIFDATFQFTGLLTPEGTVIEANRAALDFAGITLEEIVGRPFWEARWWAGDEARVTALQAAIARAAQGEFVRYEVILQGAGSTTALIDFSLKPVRNAQGDVVLLVPEGRDISAPRQAEEMLRETQNNLAAFLEQAQGFFVYRVLPQPDNPFFGKIAFVSPSITEVAGIEDPYDFANWFKNLHPEDRPRVEAANRHTAATGEPFNQVFRLFHARRQEWVWLRAICHVVRDDSGRLVDAHGLCIDITETKRAEEEMARLARENKATADRMAALIRASNTGAWEYDRTSGAVRCSPEYFSMLGREEEGQQSGGVMSIDRCWVALLHPEDRAAAMARFRAYLDNPEGMYEQVFRMAHRDGHWVWIWSRGQTLRDTDGRPTPITVGTHIDLTAQKMLEDRLRHAEKMEAIGQLAGGVAHDYNNHLAGILGNAELLMARLTDPALRGMVENIRKAALRSADLTRQLLAFARKGKYMTVPIDVHALIDDVVALLEHSLDRRITIQRRLAADPPLTMGDPAQLQSALLNLAVNARDAMPHGGDLIFATAIADLPGPAPDLDVGPGRFLKIEVTDTGTGMDEETRKHLFEPFFTTKEAGKGTGLGLAAVYGTIRNHRGAITVATALGQGTTFTIFLPLATEEAFARPSAPLPSTRPGRGRILLVEDEEMVRETALAMLESLGYQVTACVNGQEAVETFRELWRQIDLVILDLIMPRMAGRETFHAMRTIDPAVRVLVASGFSDEATARQIIQDGALGFLQKPFQLNELASKVAGLLATNKLQTAS